MFRKPKSKGAIRQRTAITDDSDEKEEKVAIEEEKPAVIPRKELDEAVAVKPTSLLLQEEGDDDCDLKFIKKKKKNQEKRMRDLQALTQASVKKEEPDENEDVLVVRPVKPLSPKQIKKERRSPSPVIARGEDLPDYEGTADSVASKFPSSFERIPDAKAVYDARKRREAQRREGFIPLDQDKKIRDKGERARLVREEDDDQSDDEDHGRFYSSRALLQTEEDRIRQEQAEFLEAEQGDDSGNEMERWEQQQISKAVSRIKVRQYRDERDMTSKMFAEQGSDGGAWTNEPPMESQEVDMDVDDGFATTLATNGPSISSTSLTMEEILEKLRLRIRDREECLNTRMAEVEKVARQIDENKTSTQLLTADGPRLALRFKVLQKTRVYVRDLLECFDEKVAELKELETRRHDALKARAERIARRRRRDVTDQYDECSAASRGLPSTRTGDAALRANERDARRARRRREREKTLEGVSHEEGLSTDDEETSTQEHMHTQILGELTCFDMNPLVASVSAGATDLFSDALEEFTQPDRIVAPFLEWYNLHPNSYENAYMRMYVPRLLAPIVRHQLLFVDILGDNSFSMERMPWYESLLRVVSLDEVEPEVFLSFIPTVLERTIIPYITRLVTDVWEPLSLRESRNLGRILRSLFADCPELGPNSKPLIVLLNAIHTRLKQTVDEDFFIPLFPRQALDNPSNGCRALLDRQFWVAIKMMRSVNALEGVLAPEMQLQLLVDGAVNRNCVLALQCSNLMDPSTMVKVRALLAQLPSLPTSAPSTLFTSLAKCLHKIAEVHRPINRDFAKELTQAIEKMEQCGTVNL